MGGDGKWKMESVRWRGKGEKLKGEKVGGMARNPTRRPLPCRPPQLDARHPVEAGIMGDKMSQLVGSHYRHDEGVVSHQSKGGSDALATMQVLVRHREDVYAHSVDIARHSQVASELPDHLRMTLKILDRLS